MTPSGRSSDASAAVRAAIDVLVYAPLGFGALLIEDSPRAVENMRRELSNARFIGRFAVDQGVAQVRRKLETTSVSDGISSDRVVAVEQPVTASSDSESDEAGGAIDSDLPGIGTLSADDLALPDYDTLPAIDIVAKLAGLGVEERDAVFRYETAHRHRRTILGKLSQLDES